MKNQKSGSVVTVGTFDGVHRGHQRVLDTLVSEARLRQLTPIAVTFDRHPLETIAPDRAPKLLTDSETRLRMLSTRGVKIECVEFTEDVRSLTCEQWISRLVKDFDMKVLVLGYDNRFGSDGRDKSVADISRLAAARGVEVIVAPIIAGCSSSAARKAILAGDAALGKEILGRPHSIAGKVVCGRKLGRTIGIPTANLELPRSMAVPAPGVYAGVAVTAKGERCNAVINIGSNPTVAADDSLHIEVHLIDFKRDIYGETLQVEFHERLRDEKKFNSLAELRAAIDMDIAAAKEYLSGCVCK